ncbi:exonuclease SbcCD subunit D [Natronomonas sp. F2-12]|jgi:DNA repair exonuclease SbcCD nuclease subunit|uniref:DNA double-strand break repair protein Mre11 n=1 Tax=Natronomonas aquatica TaxID=2841590 RepID=A0A9R1CRZ6_9EURY|nr:DNA double-strand break repair protein Mre11 [Natronomonas aquatica]MCQ4332604.1 exonuclease SbcCD subunit D [Natronomonas aquatica]
MTRVLHTADTHLGYRQYHTPERRRDFLAAFRAVIDDAIEDDVDAVVHAGDLFHDRRPGLVDILGTLEVLETLAAADIPFLAVVGNHETKRDAQWLDLFERLGVAIRLGNEPVVVGNTAFYGLDFVPRGQRDRLEYGFEPAGTDHAALVTHGLFEPLVPDYGNVEWDAEAVLTEATVEFDAMLLGDEHKPTTQQIGETWVTYPGSTERTSASEREERGYNLVTFDGDVRIARRGIETRPFVFLDLELDGSEGIDRVRDRLREYDLEGAVVHVTLEGDGESVSPARIETFATEEGALVARVTDRRDLAVEASTPEVSFADPDEAVRERLRELGLSEAARDLDGTIRSGSVADSNVADEIERRVEELIEDPEFAAAVGEPDEETGLDEVDDTTPAAGSDAGQSSMEEYL